MITVAADTLTYVDLIWIEKRVQRWIRFGSVASEQIIDRHRSIVAFAPGNVFAFVRWRRTILAPSSRVSTSCAPFVLARPVRRSALSDPAGRVCCG